MTQHNGTCCCSHHTNGNGIQNIRKYENDANVLTTAQKEIYGHTKELETLSLYLHDNPELNYKEFKAHARLTEYLEEQGFDVERSFKGVETAFKASYTQGEGRVFAFNSEYDALPGIGHACGHNLIAISGIAALLGMRAAMRSHNITGTAVLLGTPAEEGGAGKVKLLEAGAYQGIDACLMIHPSGPCGSYDGFIRPTLAVRTIFVEFKGQPAHAMVAPWQGRNALDAANIAYMSISSMRQQLQKNDYVHGIIVSGGDAANIIPKYTSMSYYCRSVNAASLEVLMGKILPCFRAAALATGCEVSFDIGTLRADVRHNLPLAELYASIMEQKYGQHLEIDLRDEAEPLGSTDFGNVTYVMPACHPTFLITEEQRLGHTAEFAIETRKPEAHDATFKSTVAMAGVGLRFLSDAAFAEESKQYWKTDMIKQHGDRV